LGQVSLADGDRRLRKHITRAMIPFLVRHRRLSRSFATRIKTIYGRASRVVHGGTCDRQRATQIVSDAQAIISRLRSMEGCSNDHDQT
jgi:hypothetical protein